ncbi:MAG: ABC transporter permease [Cyclobacteriaceae bacterium]|nr:ABC transporter permease [Cyclobacteriaceae bacterium]
MLAKYLANLNIAFSSVLSNKLRSLLTALGIIFGVAAVIAMLAIGSGAQKEILEQIKLVGVNNIVITPVIEQVEENVSNEESGGGSQKEITNFSEGLTLLDLRSIQEIIPEIQSSSPEILLETNIMKDGIRRSSKLVGVENDYFRIFNFTLFEGLFFNDHQMEKGEPVCIIGKGIQAKFFSKENPLGKPIKVGRHWLKVVGVLDERMVNSRTKDIGNLGIRDYNMDVYTPLKTVLIRYKNRALVTESILQRAQRDDEEEDEGKKAVNYHQLDKIVVQVDKTERLVSTRNIIARMLERRHYKTIDFEITIPELLLKQQQKTKSIFNFVLGAIAGISLLVGGIGIMNIMLASVMERIKEIGLRLSIGAKKRDIILQFLFEAVMISISGGLVGIILGIIMAKVVANIADIPTEVSILSIILSFGVAATVGLIFGITPARKAASQDPITSLRHE